MTLSEKIARLVQERGWSQVEFARQARLNRNTARQILTRPGRFIRNATLKAIADALQLSVNELRDSPLDRLLARVRDQRGEPPAESVPLPNELAQQPALQEWLQDHPKRAAGFTREEWDELLSLQGTGGPLTAHGLDHFLKAIERKRSLRQKMEAIAGTDYLDLLEQLVELLFEKIQPYRERKR